MKKFFFLIVLIALFIPAASAGTCALCRQTLSMGGNDGLLQGFYWSILLIAGTPLLILSFAIFHVYRMTRKGKVSKEI